MVGPPSSWSEDRRFDVTAAPNKPFRLDLLVSLFAILPTFVVAQSYQSSAAHPDPVAPVVLALAVILGVAKLEGHLAAQLGQPAVLGELVAGVALGSFDLFGIGWFRSIEGDPTVEILARLGVLILLFEVGLESTVRDMLKVGWTSVLVAVLEVLAHSRSAGASVRGCFRTSLRTSTRF